MKNSISMNSGRTSWNICSLLVLASLLITLFPVGSLSAYARTTDSAAVQASAATDGVQYIYDALGRLKAVVDPATETAIYTYDAVGNVLRIDRRSSATTSVIDVNPSSAPVGADVTISGTAFSTTASQNLVKFNGVAAMVVRATRTQLVVKVPANATSGAISVKTPAGAASSSVPFSVGPDARPAILNFSPRFATPGTAVSITGTRFAPTITDDKVRVNATYATVLSARDQSIVTRIPPLGTSGRITVATPHGTAVSTQDIFVAPAPFAATDIGSTGRMAVGTTKTFGFNRPDKIGLFLFDGAKDQRISLNVANITTKSKGIYVSIISPFGDTLVVRRWVSNSAFLDTMRLVTSGTYTIVVEPDETESGSATFTLYNIPSEAAGTVVPGTAKTVTSKVPGHDARLSLSGKANQRIGLLMPNTTASDHGVYVSILRPDGTALVRQQWMTNSSFIDTVVLPVTGNYAIYIDFYQAATGSATVMLYDVPADTIRTITPGGPEVQIGTSVPGQNAQLLFNGTANRRIGLKLTEPTTPDHGVYVSVQQPNGTTLLSSRWMSNNSFIDATVLPATGTYTISVNPDQESTGQATFTLYNVPADVGGSITMGATKRVTTTTPGQNASLTFNGAANQQVSVKLTEPAIPSNAVYVSILMPGGATHVSERWMGNNAAIVTTLPVAGSYKIVVNPHSFDVGSVSVTLSPVTGLAAQDAPAVAAPPVQEQASPPAEPARVPQWQPTTEEAWVPTAASLRGDWTTGRQPSPWSSLPPLKADQGVTALAGQILTLDGQPLAGVTVRVKQQATETDSTGRFLLTELAPGHRKLTIDGRTANRKGSTYGVFEAGVEVEEGHTVAVPYTMWMPKLDTTHTIKIASPTTTDVVVTNPAIPGLELRIPRGTTIRDIDGKIVNEIGITPIPVDRPPFPLPAFEEIPIYFTIQPGSAFISPNGAQIVYPNYPGGAAGTRASFWFYSPEGTSYNGKDDGWYVYGQGTVSQDRKQVVPDADTRLFSFTGAMFNFSRTPPAQQPSNDKKDGDPVDLSSGLFILNDKDLVVPDVMPIELTRTYRQNDPVSRPFGIGATHPYELYLWSPSRFEVSYLILPDGSRIWYQRISPGSGYADAVYEHTSTSTRWYKSRMAWNGNGWDLTLTDGTTYVFGGPTPLQAIRDRNGNQTTIHRTAGSNGDITLITTPNGRWMQFTYDDRHRVTAVTDNAGRKVSYAYDDLGRLEAVTDPRGGITRYTYNAGHQMLTITDPRNITFLKNEYGGCNGEIIKQTLADQGTYIFDYWRLPVQEGEDPCAIPFVGAGVTDPRGTRRWVTLDLNTRYAHQDMHAYRSPQEQVTTFEREPRTNLLRSETDAQGRKTTYEYDARGNLRRLTRLAGTPEAVAETYTYEPTFNQMTSRIDPLGRRTIFGYDTRGNLISVIDPLGKRTTATYNNFGQLTSVTDPMGNVTRLEYDAGDLTSIIDGRGFVTRYFVDATGRTTAEIDPAGNMTRRAYDASNHMTKITDALGGQTNLRYDGNGNLLNVVDALGRALSFSYDSMDRRTRIVDPLRRPEDYQFDKLGNITRVVDRKRQATNFQYDVLGRLAGATFSDRSSIAYTYDAGNRLTNISDTATGTITRAYDKLNRVLSETTPQGKVTYTYDKVGNRKTMQVAGQPVVTYGYDNRDNVTIIKQGTMQITYRYDAAGRRTAMMMPNNISVLYAYDKASNLTSLTYKRGSTVLGDLRYAYDATGRRASMSGSFARTGLPAAVTSATYNAANEVTRWGSATLTYDQNGNLTNDGTRTYTWNARNQLAALAGGGNAASFNYDAIGRRATRTINGTATSYLHDRWTPIQELRGTTPSANLLAGPGVDEYLVRTDGSGARAMLADGLGSIIGLVDASGGFGNSRTWYEPFGRATTNAANTNPFSFTGREDDRTGLLYFRDRYYSPVLQRFISEDPIGLGGGDVNLHAYVWNDPLNWVDPSGRSGLHNFTQPLDDRKTATNANKIYEKAIEAVDSVYDKKFEDWSKKQVLDQARKEIPVGAKEEQTALLSDIDKTAKTAVPSFFDKLKSLWTTSSDSLTGRK